MAEIASVAFGRAVQARTNPRTLSRQEERVRQAQVTRQAKASKKLAQENEKLAQALQRRTQTVNDEQRARLASQNLFDAQRESQDIRFSDQRLEFLQAEITEEILRARALENVPEPLPPLPPGELVGTVLAADDIEARDRLNSVPEPIPGPPADDRPPAQGPAPLEAPVAGVQPPDDGLESAEDQAIADGVAFDRLERDRTVRLTDKREDDRDFQVQQQNDQQIAEDRIAEIPFDSNLPRGSIVDIFG